MEHPDLTHYLGTSGYAYPAWKGSFYPDKLPTKQMLAYYAARFRAVEINYTFTTLPTAEVLATWVSQVPAEFRFALKAPQRITHQRRLQNVDDTLTAFLAVAETLKERCGPLLFQLPPNFKKNLDRLRAFLALLPAGRRTAWEFRHPSWFDDEVFALLREHQMALCIADESDDLQVPFEATADWGYLRLRRPNYSPAALKKWAARIREQSWDDAFVLFKHEDEGKGPKFAEKLLTALTAPPPRRTTSRA